MFARTLWTLGLLGALAIPAWAQDAAPAAAGSKDRIINTWVAPYAIDASYTALQQKYGTAGPRNSLTRIGLQFWLPTSSGGLRRDTQGDTSDATIKKFVTWAHKYGIQVLLCVYNNDGSWDWNLATSAFATNRRAFVAALVKEMQAQKLDGIDIDLEGYGVDTSADQTSYVNFIKALSKKVHALGKIVTLDSTSASFNVPSTDWWNDLFPHVDGITSMGYEELGRNPTDAGDWRAYSWQVTTAGRYAAKLTIGLPAYLNSWEGDTAQSQVDWFLHAGRVGISIWDAQFSFPAWQTPGVWKDLKKIRAQ